MSNSQSIQDDSDPKLRALVARALAPADLQGLSKSELEAILDAESPQPFADDQLEFLFEKLDVLLREESKKTTTNYNRFGRYAVAPVVPVLGFLGNLTQGLRFSPTPTFWALLILISGMVFTCVVVMMVAVRGIRVQVDQPEVAMQRGRGDAETRGGGDTGTPGDRENAAKPHSPLNEPDASKETVKEQAVKEHAAKEQVVLQPASLRGGVAMLGSVVDPQWSEGLQPAVGDILGPGRIALRKGLARLQFLSGASVVLEGPAEIDLVSEMEAQVHRGKITANVPAAAQGFLLTAGNWRVLDRGTDFVLQVSPGGQREVYVVKGKVEVSRDAARPAELTLGTGEAARMSDAGATRIAAVPKELTTGLDMTQRLAASQAKRLAAWKQASAALAKDPSLLFYYDFENSNPLACTVISDRALSNRSALPGGALSPRDGALVGAEWVAGRWPGKKAVEFRRAGNLVRTAPKTKSPSATFLAWIRVDNLTHELHVIALDLYVRPGQFYWLLQGDGRMMFIKRRANDQEDEMFPTPVVFQGKVLGRWNQVAVVCDHDRAEVKQYLNGKLVSRQPCSDASPVDFEECVIGNWGYSDVPRGLAGRIDEFAVFSRPLADNEIARIYREGKPEE